MQKITEIKEYYTVKRKENVNGVTTEVEKKLTRFKDVNTVSGWPRFGHYLLDYICFAIFSFIVWAIIGVILALMGYAYLIDDEGGFEIIARIINWLVLFPTYYIIFESSMGSSLGKAIMGRVVVDEYGNKPSFSQIIKRSFSRAVPFEAFSCLGERGWHDNWSDTYVLRKKDLEDLKLAIKINNLSAELPNTPDTL